MTVTVIIPTYNRHDYLRRCLQSLENQERKADCILIVAPKDDAISREIATGVRSSQVVILDSPPGGVRTALNLAFDHCTTEIMVLTDDDSEAFPDWLRRIEKHFTDDPLLSAVGGRDELQYNNRPELSDPPATDQIGRFTALGKLYGNHHRPPISDLQETDSLKGVNLALRRKAVDDIRIDDALRGNFAQVAWELVISFKLRARGWRLLFDKQLPIRHWVGPRASEDIRAVGDSKAGADSVYNTTYALARYGPLFRSLLFSIREILIGGRGEPGIIGAVYLIARGDSGVWPRLCNQLPARLQGLAAGWAGWAGDSRRLFFSWPALRKNQPEV